MGLGVPTLVGLLAACGGDDDDSDGESGGGADAAVSQFDAAPLGCPDSEPSASQAANNSAFLTGAALGTAEEGIDLLRKEIEVNLTTESSLRLGTAWAMRSTSSQPGVYLAIEISNPTAELVCRIAAQPYQWRDAGGGALETRERVYATGTVADPDPLYSTTCLGQNETGYLLDVTSDDLFDQLASVDLELSSTAEGAALPEAALVPTAYSLGDAGRVEVAFENTGTAAGTLDPEAVFNGEFVLLDDQGAPLLWATFADDLTPTDGVVAAGAEGSLAGSLQYAGCASAMRVFLAFTP